MRHKKIFSILKKAAFFIIMSVILGGVLKCTIFPDFVGKYSSRSRDMDLFVENNRGALEVSKKDPQRINSGYEKFPASKYFMELRFGVGINLQSIIYKPWSGKFYLVSGSDYVELEKESWFGDVVKRHPYIALFFAMAVMIVGIFTIFEQKAKTHPQIIYPTWLVFFFTLFLSAEVLVFAGENGFYDANGHPVNIYGKIILDVVEFILDIKSDTIIFGTFFLTLAVPQWCAYAMSGLHRSAREVKYVKLAWQIAASLMAKSFISSAAVAMSISLVGGHYGWIHTPPVGVIADLAIFMLLFSYGLILLFFSSPSDFKAAKKGGNSKIQKFVVSSNAWMTQRVMANRLNESGSNCNVQDSISSNIKE
ncbi:MULTISPECIES: hypothetical protein [Burkholderia]|uniref:hypothetical protein n=1 Tax=Burkholderia TaxID=32008 RepID=UPI00117877F1|nr:MULTISPECIES: hypothetical protein [Burkholderia]MBY4726877.1 hypothetical protein [Burkholderia contaminans]MCI3967777.1 hypothetical protein [Burkholderia sp. HI4860]MDN7792988.1 hypothetical protein [Burkholderia contaminans]